MLVPLCLFSSNVLADTPAGWYQQDADTTGPLYCVSAVDSETIWAGGSDPSSGALALRSVDGGSTWTQSLVPAPSPYVAYIVYGMSAVDADKAWAGGWSYFDRLGGFISRTNDGGGVWNPQFGGRWVPISCVSAVDETTAWAGTNYLGSEVNIIRTTDGSTWSLVYGEIVGAPAIYGISSVDANTVWGVGGQGMILKTTDVTNWVHQDFLTTSTLRSVSAVDPSTAWAVGDGGLIIHTTNGTNWSAQSSGVTTDLTGIAAVSTSIAWAVGKGGVILKTNDGGATWTTQNSGVTTNLNGVSAVDSNTAWAVGDGGVVLHTTTGGVVPPLGVTSITPNFGVENTIVNVTNLAGTGFRAGLTVSIEKPGTTVIATDVNVVSSTKITCKLNLSGAPLGKYDVVVGNPGAPLVKLTKGFSVTNICGGGAAISLFVFGLMMGLMSLAGSAGLRRRFSRKKK